MTTELRFEGRVAIVTGAGGNPSLGRAHCRLLASRGAKVVVNNVGHDPRSRLYPQDTHYKDQASAQAVAEEINACGGEAVADTNDVATEEGATSIIQGCLDQFGRVDILVNNAGVCPISAIQETSSMDIRRTIDINVLGTIWLCRAVWPHMVRASYGRIVNVSAVTVTGLPMLSIYSASKAAVFTLTRSLAVEGAGFGIKCNSVSPAAYTRMLIAMQPADSKIIDVTRRTMPAELVSPIVGLLAHEECPTNGENFNAGGGRVSRTYLSGTQGVLESDLSMEWLRDNIDQVVDETGSIVWGPGKFGNMGDLSADDVDAPLERVDPSQVGPLS